MNRLDPKTRAQIINLLCEGMAIRAIVRVTGASKNTISKLAVDIGRACSAYQDRVLRNLTCKRVQVDEIWSFIYAKNDNVKRAKSAPVEAGDAWTWTAIDADTKLLVSFLVAGRDTESALYFMDDLKQRLANRVQLTSDGHRPYLVAVDTVFGEDVDFAQLVKIYGADTKGGERRYSPAICLGAKKRPVTGDPDPKHISTSFAERHNLTMRMQMRRFTRLTNAFSKKLENHVAAVALHSMFYNFVRVHQTLKISPAMAAGVTDKLWEVSDLIEMLEAFEAKEGRDTKPLFEICEDTISKGAFVRATLPDGTVDRVYGFANDSAAARWIKNDSVVWLHDRRHNQKVT